MLGPVRGDSTCEEKCPPEFVNKVKMPKLIS